MGQLTTAVRKAASVVWGSGPWSAGQTAGVQAGSGTFSTTFDAGIARSIVDGMEAGDLYATQPHLRTVVSFVARNGAQLGRHIYKDGSKGRERVKDTAAANLLQRPNDYMTGYELFSMLFSELALYDMALWVPKLTSTGWQIDPIPGEWVTGIKLGDAFHVAGYRVKYPDKTAEEFLPASQVITFRGYSPHGFQRGSSAVRSLRGTLGEQVSAMEFRAQMWKRGGRVGMFMTRPADAPEWSKEAKQKFIQNWRNNWSGDGTNAGSTPLLEDGMELKRVGFNAKEEQWLEAATLSLSTVAGAYHVPPAMVGVSGYNSFASVKEFRKMLYTETLGPSIAQVEDTVNQFLLPFIGEPEGNYFELNIHEKLQGDFEDQAEQLYQAIGGPYMTVNEARRRMNLPDIDGGDDLLAPLNMGAAGNNGPLADEPLDQEPAEDSENEGPEKTATRTRKAARTGLSEREPAIWRKAPADEDYIEEMASDIRKLLRRQSAEVAGKITAGEKADPSWWDQKKWNRELSGILQPHMTGLSAGVARRTAGAKGLDPEAYSVGRTTNFLKSVADSRADLINATTRDQLAKAAAESTEDGLTDAIDHVFEVAYEERAVQSASTMGTMLKAWAVTEVARQLVPDRGPTKTWIGSGLPDSRHAGMNGETVPIDEPFSNGAQWPGDPVLGAKGVANCACGVDINFD